MCAFAAFYFVRTLRFSYVAANVGEAVQNFYKYEYSETKDLAKQFLAVVTGVLVFSLTFSEKIVRYDKAARSARWAVRTSWLLHGGAILAAGFAIFLVSIAFAAFKTGGGLASHRVAVMMGLALMFLTMAGLLFVTGLVALVCAGFFASSPKEAEESKAWIVDFVSHTTDGREGVSAQIKEQKTSR
jgi:hypothetical protein